MLRDLKGPIERHHCFNFFVSERFCVSFHCSAYVPMPHNILEHLNVDILLTHTGAKSVPQDMCADLRKVARLAPLFPRFCVLFFVIRGCDTLDRVVDKGLRVDFARCY